MPPDAGRLFLGIVADGCAVTFVNRGLHPFALGLLSRLPWSTEEHDVAVRVANLEPAKTIVGILERYAECCSMIGKFNSERVRVGCIDEGIPSHRGIAL